MQFDGDLNLWELDSTGAQGYASGGFMADSKINGQVDSGSQQQWLTRNSDFSSWNDSGFNIVFLGNENAPESHCGNEDGLPYTTVEKTPLIAEKPFIVEDDDKFSLIVPKPQKDKVGPSSSDSEHVSIPFE